MRKIILLAVLALAVAMPAFASVNNIKVSGSVDTTYLYRANFDLGDNYFGDETQNLTMTQTMVQVDAELTENVATTVCLINERAWSQKANVVANDANINIHYAYATLREMLYSPLTVVVGRQAFKYGNSFVVDSSGTNNSAPADSGILGIAGDLTKQTAQDAARLIFDYNPLTLEFLWAKINSNTVALANDDDDDIDLYGTNISYELGDAWNSMVEGYFFARIDKSVGASNTANLGGSEQSDNVYVPGLRLSTNPIEGLNLQGEFAWQGGNRVLGTSAGNTATYHDYNQRRNAIGGQAIVNYQIPVFTEYKPTAEYVLTYVSGDKNPNLGPQIDEGMAQNSAERYTAWDPLFENQGGGKIYNAIFNLTNMQIHSASFSVSPIEDVLTKFSWTGLWLDKQLEDQATFNLVQPDNTAASVDVDQGKSDLGFELDLDAVYDYTEDVQIGASLGWFFPGGVFDRGSINAQDQKNDNMASQALVHMNVNF